MTKAFCVPVEEFRRVSALPGGVDARLALAADMVRLNALAAIKCAGSGHPGSTLSSADIMTLLVHETLDLAGRDPRDPHRDVFFSSKGHDCPAFYATLHSAGLMDLDALLRLRRADGPCGHPDVSTPRVEANSGSLGMGVSKARGMALAKRMRSLGGRVVVLTGDGEFQEGQIYEALQSAAFQGLANLTVIIDHNQVQSDRTVASTLDLGDLAAKLRAFGWLALECDGHDFASLRAALARCAGTADRPQAIVARTVKGRGVSFMEHPAALAAGGGYYDWHSGAPSDRRYAQAAQEILSRLGQGFAALGAPPPGVLEREIPAASARWTFVESLADAWGQTLVELGREVPELVVLDGDLMRDCRLRAFAEAFPERFIECGIAEQDMVSVAGGLALHGLVPVVNSFAAFLASRANEQIYNNAGEGTRIVHGLHYAGLLPAGPGHTHQSVRDISVLASVPGMTVLQPACAEEVRLALRWCVTEAPGPSAVRLPILPAPVRVLLSQGYVFTPGRGVLLREGRDAVLCCCGPVLIRECLEAAELLAAQGLDLSVAATAWVNRVDSAWLAGILEGRRGLFVAEDHAPAGGLGDRLLSTAAASGLAPGVCAVFGVQGVPRWGTHDEVLELHGLDARSLARRIGERLG